MDTDILKSVDWLPLWGAALFAMMYFDCGMEVEKCGMTV